MKNIVVGVLGCATIYTMSIIILCIFIVRKMWILILFIINLCVFLIFLTGYIKNWRVFELIGESYDICYFMCKLHQSTSNTTK